LDIGLQAHWHNNSLSLSTYIHAMLVLHLNTELPIIANRTDILCTHVMASEKLKIRSFYQRQPLGGGVGKERSFLPFKVYHTLHH
jgi:hypothetical protein